MRLLYFLGHPEGLGGAANQMLIHAHVVKNAGHDVCVVIQNRLDGSHCPEFDTICDLYGLKKMECIYSIATCIENIDIVDSMYRIKEITRLIKDYDPQIVHSLQINTSVEIACRILEIPHVMSIYPLSEGMFNIKWDDVFPQYIISDSVLYADSWGKGLKANSKCVRVCYPRKRVQNSGAIKKTHDYELLTIGVFTPYKNQLEVIKFTEKLAKKGLDVCLTLLGDYSTEYGRKCFEYVVEKDLEKRVLFKGFVFEIEDYLNRADVLIHASYKESYPGVIVEAMANHTPVIAFPTGGIPELIKDGENGLLLEGTRSNDLYKSFGKFLELQTDGKLEKLKKRAYDTYLRNHSEESVLTELIDYYSKMIDDANYIGDYKIIDYVQYSLLRFQQSKAKLSDFTQRKIWFLWHIKTIIGQKDYKNALVWGAGKFGEYAIEWCTLLGIEIIGFLDSYKNGMYMGYPVFEPDEDRVFSADIVFVAISNIEICGEIQNRLDSIGKVRNMNYFFLQNDPCM